MNFKFEGDSLTVAVKINEKIVGFSIESHEVKNSFKLTERDDVLNGKTYKIKSSFCR